MSTPEWMTSEGLRTLRRGYLAPGETHPSDLYRRLAKAAASYYDGAHEEDFYDAMWRGWLCPASPVLSNLGHPRGLPISCYGIHPGDSVDSIFGKAHEQAMLAKNGGGLGIYLGDIRSRGSAIGNGNGTSEGIVPWAKLYDTTTLSVSQGGVRKGAAAVNLPIDHPDFDEYLRIRRPEGDPNRQCMNLHHAAVVTDDFMARVEAGDPEARERWISVLRTRLETGEPYIIFADNMNRDIPQGYRDLGLKVSQSNLCTEIALHTDEDHSFVCCLSSLNLARYDEWRDTPLVRTAVYFLEAVMQAFIDNACDLPGFENAVRFARKSRALGLGVLGWHTYLQQHMTPFVSREAMNMNRDIWVQIRGQSVEASRELAQTYGEPEWCKGTGRRHTHLTAVAPTVSNSLISGGVSPGVMPIMANAMSEGTAKGVFSSYNRALRPVLAKYGMDNDDVWHDIAMNQGSVQHLTQLSDHEREVFLTAPETNQLGYIQQAAQRQVFLEQAQSLDLFFPADVSPKWFNQVHLEAWKSGVKSLYYVRSKSVLDADVASRAQSADCVACAD